MVIDDRKITATDAIVALNRFVNVACYTYVLRQIGYGYLQVEQQAGNLPGGIYKYFTVWTVIISLAFYFVCGLCEIFVYLKFDTDKFSFRGLVYHALVFPLGLTVSAIFWMIYFSDQMQVFLPETRLLFGQPLVNHIIHSLPLIGLSIEGFFYFHPLPPRAVGLRLFFVIAISYLALLSYHGLNSNYWVYSFLQNAPLPMKYFSLLGILFLGSLVYLIGEKLHQIIWREKLKED